MENIGMARTLWRSSNEDALARRGLLPGNAQ